jgi:hypothetical protein
VLDTYVERRGNVTPTSHIYSLYSPYVSGNLWTLYQVRRKVSLSYPSLSLSLSYHSSAAGKALYPFKSSSAISAATLN